MCVNQNVSCHVKQDLWAIELVVATVHIQYSIAEVIECPTFQEWLEMGEYNE